jgi:hypothetical protein
VSGTAGGYATFVAGYPVEEEPNSSAGNASRLFLEGAVQGEMSGTDAADMYLIQIAFAGTYAFETTGLSGAFCGFALDLDTVLDLMDSNQAIIGSSVDFDPANQNFCSRITQALAPGTYYLRVSRDVISGFVHTGRYILQARLAP